MATQLLRPRQAAQLAGQTVETIRRWCREGTLPAARVNGRWLIDPAALNELLHADAPFDEGQKVTLLGGAVLTGHIVDERDGNLVLSGPPHWLELLVPLDLVVKVA